MRRMWLILGLVCLAACGSDDPVDMAWGGTCPGGRYGVMAIDGEQGPATPEFALERLLHPARVEGAGPYPGDALPDDGWERADFVPTPDGTSPVSTVASGTDNALQVAFVHRNGDRIDAVVGFQLANGWVVSGVHACAD